MLHLVGFISLLRIFVASTSEEQKAMNKEDTILDEIIRKQLIWYGHVEIMDPTRLPEIMINWKPEGRKKKKKKRGLPRRTLERWDIYSHE